jgi:hypothetical protein
LTEEVVMSRPTKDPFLRLANTAFPFQHERLG